MTTNETVLIVVTAIAALVLVGSLVGVVYKTRSRKRGVAGGSIREEMEADARQARPTFTTQRQQAAPEPTKGQDVQ